MAENERDAFIDKCADKMGLSTQERMDFYFSVLDGKGGEYVEKLYFSDNGGEDTEVVEMVARLSEITHYVAPRHKLMDKLEEELGMPCYQYLGAQTDTLPQLVGVILTVNDMLEHEGIDSTVTALKVLTGRF